MDRVPHMPPPASFQPDLALWDAWSPDEVAQRLRGVRVPWCVAAGWAIDLFLGQHRRDHEDLEIAVPHDRFDEVAAAFSGYELFVVGDGRAVSRAHADNVLESWHQTWVREPETGSWRLDIFREPSRDGQWVCRRDARIQLPYASLIEHTAAGIPYARPEVVLLFKAKAVRPKDEHDFAAVLPHLDGERRGWLAAALHLVHPGHPWHRELRD